MSMFAHDHPRCESCHKTEDRLIAAEHKAQAAQGVVERLQQEIENHKGHYRKLLEAYNEQGARLARYTTTEA